ncbi:hypothetical protein U9M48_041024 [Paspalum notatum var. saurae]|uniref:Protein FAR1-RELATED SEQUENCE n=1 Tax=Paspalum notatum var. saurae TaxID=547442 RepID=A0AAQ3XG47_PASNO
MERNNISSKHAWVLQMYQMRNLWCAAYQVGRCFLGLRSNQRSESLNSKLHKCLKRKMSLFDMLQHYEQCVSDLRRNEAKLDSDASQSIPFTEPDADSIEKDAARIFTPKVFALVKKKIDCFSNYVIVEILDDGCERTTYIIASKNKRDYKFYVDCDFKDAILDTIGCTYRKLQRDGIPCGHIFFVLKIMHAERIPKCCVNSRWTMTAKSAFPPIRKSSMYDSCQSLLKYRELRNLSHEAAFKASQSNETYEHMKHVLNQIVGSYDDCSAQIEHGRYGPVLSQALHPELANDEKVQDPVKVKPRGAPKKDKRMEAFQKKKREVTCSQCKQKGHNRRTCPKLKELESHDQDLD